MVLYGIELYVILFLFATYLFLPTAKLSSYIGPHFATLVLDVSFLGTTALLSYLLASIYLRRHVSYPFARSSLRFGAVVAISNFVMDLLVNVIVFGSFPFTLVSPLQYLTTVVFCHAAGKRRDLIYSFQRRVEDGK